MIDIDNRHRHRQFMLHGERDLMLEDDRQIAAVEQAGQGVFTVLHLRQTAEDDPELAADFLAKDVDALEQSLRIFIFSAAV